jgi:hypothetical protein
MAQRRNVDGLFMVREYCKWRANAEEAIALKFGDASSDTAHARRTSSSSRLRASSCGARKRQDFAASGDAHHEKRR